MASCFDSIPHENLEHCPNDEINSSISDDDAFMAYYLLEKKKKEENKS